MNSDQKSRKLPPGIRADYETVYAVGTHGPINEDAIVSILHTELNPQFQGSLAAIEQSWSYIRQDTVSKDFLKAYAAFREVTQIYPLSAENWHSGERIPISHAKEVATDALVLAFQAHYKSAYKSLREIFELIVLQAYFYKEKDKSIIGKWGRGEERTSLLKIMLKQLGQDSLYQAGDKKLNVSNRISKIYDDLGAYVHTRGVPTVTMGLTGSNILVFTPDALDRFLTLFTSVAHLCVMFLAIFFPAAIIHVPAFAKFGHLDPVWLPRKDKVDSIRSILSKKELKALDDLASQNAWFQQLVVKINALPDLSKAEVDETYERLEAASRQGPEQLIRILKEANKVLE